MKQVSQLACCFAFCACVLTAPALGEPSAPFFVAKQYFDRAVAEDTSATDRALSEFKCLYERYPDHPLYVAYYGAARGGRDAWMPLRKLKYAESGADLMEKAAASLDATHDKPIETDLPESLETRMVVASSLIAYPATLNRFPAAKRVIDLMTTPEALAAAPPPARSRILILAGQVARHDKNVAQERSLLKQAVVIWPAGTSAQAARNRLEEIGE